MLMLNQHAKAPTPAIARAILGLCISGFSRLSGSFRRADGHP